MPSSDAPERRPLVLVIEDYGAIAQGLVRELSTNGYEPTWARTGSEGLHAATEAPPDLVLLDLGLPDVDGVHVCRSLRRSLPAVPIVIVTARDAEVDIVVGLDAGATDYVTKPFSTHVLLARLRAHLRTAALEQAAELVFDDLHLDVAGFRAHRGSTELNLRPKELTLLLALASVAGRLVTRERLLADVWDVEWDTETKTLDVHVHAVRRKLGDRPGGRPWITTVRSIGYRFEP
jgi:DNA-binding response OmpR family regulator